jgi:hypothetical protein
MSDLNSPHTSLYPASQPVKHSFSSSLAAADDLGDLLSHPLLYLASQPLRYSFSSSLAADDDCFSSEAIPYFTQPASRSGTASLAA